MSVPAWLYPAPNSLPGYTHPGSEHTYYGGYTRNRIAREPDIGRQCQRYWPVAHDMGYIVPCKDMLPHSILSILTNGYLSKDEKPDYWYPDGVIMGGCHRYQKTRDVNSNPTVPHTCYRISKICKVSLLYPLLVYTKRSGVTRGDRQNAEWGSNHRCNPVATHAVSVPVWL